jgi:aminodeoxyfutalosine synthase
MEAMIADLLEAPNLLDLGQRADHARRDRNGNTVTYVTVAEIAGDVPADIPDTVREVRIVGRPESIDAAAARVHAAKAVAGTRALTGFSLADLIELASAGGAALRDVAARLSAAGLESIADVPIDLVADPASAVRDVLAGGLAAWRVTVQRAVWTDRLALLEKVSELQRATGAVRVFAPLPRADSREEPSTGFDDVRTIAAARLLCDVPRIQVDWPLYGPKLAQVALTYGADDIDGVPAGDPLGLGWRRAPVEDVERNIRAAGLEPQLRSGRF